jgi:siroheme synthase-like protein
VSLLVSLRPALGRALVVGGGAVAARKVSGLVAAGFEVIVVAPAICEAIRSSPATLRERAFLSSDVDQAALVYACTDDREINQQIGGLCREAAIPVNVVDAPDESTFFSLAVTSSGNISVGVSTNGADPAEAARIRDRIAALVGAMPQHGDGP